MSITNEELLKQLEPWCESLTRDAWLPIIGSKQSRSHFGGVPSLPADQHWPACPNCKKAWQLFLQLDLGDLPAEMTSAHGPGLLQFFYCTEEDCEQMEGWSPHANGHGFFVQTDSELDEAAIPPGHEPFPTKNIEGWQKVEDYPAAQDHEENGLEWDFDFAKNVVHISCEQLNLEFKNLPMEQVESETVTTVQLGDKLGCLLYTSPSPRDRQKSRMPSSA